MSHIVNLQEIEFLSCAGNSVEPNELMQPDITRHGFSRGTKEITMEDFASVDAGLYESSSAEPHIK